MYAELICQALLNKSGPSNSRESVGQILESIQYMLNMLLDPAWFVHISTLPNLYTQHVLLTLWISILHACFFVLFAVYNSENNHINLIKSDDWMLQKIDCLELDTTAVESIVLHLTGYNLQLQVVSSYINGWIYLLYIICITWYYYYMTLH